jgi:hypothetical protein
MGKNLLIPIIFTVLVWLHALITSINMTLIEIIIIPLSCWWQVWLFNEIFQQSNIILFRSYPKKLIKYISKNYFINMFLYIVFIALLFYPILAEKQWINFSIQVIPQVIFLNGMVLLVHAIFGNLELTLLTPFLYLSAALLGILDLIRVHKIFFFTNNSLSAIHLVDKSFITLMYGISITILAFLTINKKLSLEKF